MIFILFLFATKVKVNRHFSPANQTPKKNSNNRIETKLVNSTQKKRFHIFQEKHSEKKLITAEKGIFTNKGAFSFDWVNKLKQLIKFTELFFYFHRILTERTNTFSLFPVWRYLTKGIIMVEGENVKQTATGVEESRWNEVLCNKQK